MWSFSSLKRWKLFQKSLCCCETSIFNFQSRHDTSRVFGDVSLFCCCFKFRISLNCFPSQVEINAIYLRVKIFRGGMGELVVVWAVQSHTNTLAPSKCETFSICFWNKRFGFVTITDDGFFGLDTVAYDCYKPWKWVTFVVFQTMLPNSKCH